MCAEYRPVKIFLRQVKHLDAFGKELLELASCCCEHNTMACIGLCFAELDYIAFNSAFFELRNYVKDSHDYSFLCVIFLLGYTRML